MDDSFAALKRKLMNEFGLNIGNYKDSFIARRLDIRLRATGCGNYLEYSRFLSKYADEFFQLENCLSVQVSEFFRDKHVWDKLHNILASLALNKVKNNLKIIRILSAGCSRGEEAYSIAILLEHILGEEIKHFILSVTGLDLDQKALEFAKKGVYTKDKLKNVDKILLLNYFDKHGDSYMVKDIVKKLVRFKRQDLFKFNESHFDVILCRNVFIYFSKEEQCRLLEKFYNALNFDGYLVLGNTEALDPKFSKKFSTVDIKGRIYQRLNK